MMGCGCYFSCCELCSKSGLCWLLTGPFPRIDLALPSWPPIYQGRVVVMVDSVSLEGLIVNMPSIASIS